MITGLIDILLVYRTDFMPKFFPAFQVSQFGFIGFVIVQAYFLAVKSARSYRYVEELSERLAQTNQKLDTEIIEVKRAQEEAAQANRVKSVFLDMISHELRTPLHGIAGFTDLLKKRLKTQNDSMLQDLTNLLQKSIQRLSTVILDILAVKEIEQKGTIELSEFPLRILVDELNMNAKRYISSKSISYSVQSAISLETVIRSDKNRIMQVLDNLLENAVHFTESGNINIQIEVDTQPMLCFSVIDTGIGISEEHHKKIFDPFVQIEQTLSRSVQGIGLGLTICRNNAQLLSGNIDIVSVLGQGSTFTFRIPFVQIGEIPAASQSSTGDISQKKILYCDDDAYNLAFLQMILESKVNYQGVEQGKQAVELAKKIPFDLIFMDIQMPVMDGIEALHQIRKIALNSKTPIVALTAQAMPGDRERFLNEGFDGYIAKPFEEEYITQFLNDLFGK